MSHDSLLLDDSRAPLPRKPRPIVVLGAGGIVKDAHLPAYAKAGLPVIALADRDAWVQERRGGCPLRAE